MSVSNPTNELVVYNREFANKVTGKPNLVILIDEFWINSSVLRSKIQKLEDNGL